MYWRKTALYSLLSLCFASVLFASATGFYFWRWLHQPMVVLQSEPTFNIEKGETLAGVANDLNQRGLLTWPLVWRIYSRFIDATPIKAGEYKFAASISPAELLNVFQSGKVIQYSVTLIEGQTLGEYIRWLHQQPKLKREFEIVHAEIIAQRLGITQSSAEGWFFPDTYKYTLGDSELDILRRAHKVMKQKLGNAWANKDSGLPYKTEYEALIMASIIEKETGVIDERGVIAGVFINRLQKKMRLQTDPTVIYGLGEAFDGNLTRAHLKTPTPFNTYTQAGLPPTPIANPGLGAIEAAMHPVKHPYLYFVARGDGSHEFNSTLDAHTAAVKKYQVNRRATQYRSSPTQGDP